MRNTEKELSLELTNMKRNPYLADYGEHKKARKVRIPRSMAQNEHTVASVTPAVRTTAGTTIRTNTRAAVSRTSVNTAYRRQSAKEKRRKAIFYKKMLLIAGMILILASGAVFVFQSVQQARAKAEAETAGAAAKGQDNIFFDDLADKKIQGIDAKVFGTHPTWTEDFLTPNEYSRPGDALEEVNSVFVHYTANQGTSAAQNRSYFEQLKDTQERSASAHFIIGYEGEIIQCIPLDEIAYAVQTRNQDSISIECCYLEKDGSFTQETYDALISLLKWLTDTYRLDNDDILRHYDCGGKKCPLYYAEHEDAWEQLKRDVK